LIWKYMNVINFKSFHTFFYRNTQQGAINLCNKWIWIRMLLTSKLSIAFFYRNTQQGSNNLSCNLIDVKVK
jgi:hypothetical protein